MPGNLLLEWDNAVAVALSFPGVDDIDVGIARIAHAAGNHRLSPRADSGIVHFRAK